MPARNYDWRLAELFQRQSDHGLYCHRRDGVGAGDLMKFGVCLAGAKGQDIDALFFKLVAERLR